jgi:hypothetical protein
MTSFVTMAEIARIAGVSRQAVTNWRSRSSIVPFPSPAPAARGIEHFDRDEVVDWLEATGRGLNKDARLDAPAISIPEGLAVDDAVVILALRSGAAQDIGPLKPDERIGLAQELDPENRYLLDEVTSLASDDALAAYVDELLEASYGAADALDRLYASRAAQVSRGLSALAVAIVQQLAEVCRTFLGPDGVAIEIHVDPRDRHVADGFEAAGPHSDRAALQYHAIDGLQLGLAGAPLVKVVSLAGLGDAEALRAAGDISVELDADQIAIVIGPASALCDRLRGDLYEARKAALEMGSMDYGSALSAGFKLPRGLWREAHRQSLGLWVLRGATAATGAVVADISGATVDGVELSADLLGALEQTGARSYCYGRPLPYAAVWTGDTVVPPGIGAQPARAVESASAYDRLVGSTLVTREAIPGVDLQVARGVSPGLGVERSLGVLVEAGAIRRQSGSRIAPEDVDTAGSVRILMADADASAERWIDRLVVAARYNSAVLTEPGDVVFSTNPPRATVDEVGGAIVATPSRILRLDRPRAGLGPRALAAAINCLGENSEWRTWPIPAFPPDQVQRVEHALGDVADYLARVRKHEVAAADLITSLIQGVAAGAVILDQPNTEKKAG